MKLDLPKIIKKVCDIIHIDSVFVTNTIRKSYDFSDISTAILDARSASYFATGSIGETHKPSILICFNDIESRSPYSGLTEAYYKKMPLIYITISNGFTLNYGIELSDVVGKTVNLEDENSEESIIGKMVSCIKLSLSKSVPLHIILKDDAIFDFGIFNKFVPLIIEKIFSDDNYIFIGNGIHFETKFNIHRNVSGDEYGVLANVLGASLDGKKKKYIGLCTEEEFLLDINTLGNRHINNKISYCVFSRTKANIISGFASSCGFDVYYGIENADILNKNKKAVLIIGE